MIHSGSNGPRYETTKCPLWVKSGHVHRKRPCPLYPRKRTCAVQELMSALCQKQTSPISLNYIVGAGDQCRWHGKTKCLGSLEVDDEVVLGWQLDWKIAGFSPLRMRAT